MSVVKVRSHIRNGHRVNSYSRSSRKSPYRQGDCSPRGIIKNFRTATKQTQITKAITTGNKALDFIIQSKLMKKTPVTGGLIKDYNLGNTIGANIARGQIALTESCFSKNRK